MAMARFRKMVPIDRTMRCAYFAARRNVKPALGRAGPVGKLHLHALSAHPVVKRSLWYGSPAEAQQDRMVSTMGAQGSINRELNGRRKVDWLLGILLPTAPGFPTLFLDGLAFGIVGASWSLWLFAWRRVWIPSFSRVIYGGRMRWIAWPMSVVDQSSFERIMQAFTWGWLVIGVLILIQTILAPH